MDTHPIQCPHCHKDFTLFDEAAVTQAFHQAYKGLMVPELIQHGIQTDFLNVVWQDLKAEEPNELRRSEDPLLVEKHQNLLFFTPVDEPVYAPQFPHFLQFSRVSNHMAVWHHYKPNQRAPPGELPMGPYGNQKGFPNASWLMEARKGHPILREILSTMLAHSIECSERFCSQQHSRERLAKAVPVVVLKRRRVGVLGGPFSLAFIVGLANPQVLSQLHV